MLCPGRGSKAFRSNRYPSAGMYPARSEGPSADQRQPGRQNVGGSRAARARWDRCPGARGWPHEPCPVFARCCLAFAPGISSVLAQFFSTMNPAGCCTFDLKIPASRLGVTEHPHHPRQPSQKAMAVRGCCAAPHRGAFPRRSGCLRVSAAGKQRRTQTNHKRLRCSP